MRLQAWQVGLDIQAGFVRAIAVQRRRYGWQLRHWWQHPLPPISLRGGILHETAGLSAILSVWQHSLPQPDARLSGAARSAFIFASGARHFPLSTEQLVMDYRAAPAGDNAIIVTAARRQEVEQWQHVLAASGLFPEVIELAPCALQLAASASGVSGEKLLFHRLDEGWLWVSPHGLPFQFGAFDDEEVSDVTTLNTLARAQYRASRLCEEGSLFSGAVSEPLPEGIASWSPLTAIGQLSAPLPAHPGSYALAVGLAIRAVDR